MANRNLFPGVDMNNVNSGRLVNAVSGAVTTSWIFPIHQMDNIDIEITTTGTLTSAFTILMSSSYRQSQGVNSTPTVIQAGTFTDITANALTKYPNVTHYGTDPAGGTSTQRYCIFQCPAQFIKITNTATSGAGNVTIYVNAKGF